MSELIKSVEYNQINPNVPEISPGDTVRVHARIVEGNRERVQIYEGIVIAKKGGGANETFTVRRVAAHGIGVERTFLLNSPRSLFAEIASIPITLTRQALFLSP